MIETNLTPDSVSEHEELYNDMPPVQRKSDPKCWFPCRQGCSRVFSMRMGTSKGCENQLASGFIPPDSVC